MPHDETVNSVFSRTVLKALFTTYLVGLFYLLFVYERSIDFSWMARGGWSNLVETMASRVNLIPFSSILGYLADMNMATGMRSIVTNIGGHMFAFAWLGYFLPRIWPKYLNLKAFLIIVLIGLVLIEILQYFTMSGMLDIDDVLLNIIGAYLGFTFFRRPQPLEGENHG